MIELRVGPLDKNRGHLDGIVTAWEDEVMIFQDTVHLDVASSRHQFAAEVVRFADHRGIEVDQDVIERKLLEILDDAAKQADAPGPGAEGLLALLGSSKPSDLLVKLTEDAEFFHTPDDEPFMTLDVNGHRETWPLRSTACQSLLRGRYFAKYESALRADALRDALGVLEAKAHFEGPTRSVYTRIAELGGAVYLDLANDPWQVVEVTSVRWRVLSDSPVVFRRPKGMLPLPIPTRDGSLGDLRPFVNLAFDDAADVLLTLSWLLHVLRGSGPFAILMLFGQQGSAKSTTARVLRALVDPNVAPVRARPRDEVDLLIAARGGTMVAYDNLSGLSDELSDAFCRLASGGGIGRRQLYTDSEEILLDAMRPIILNGIEHLARRGDLADRSLVLELPPIPKKNRRDERRFWRQFELARPGILGALLDVLVSALAAEPTVKITEWPRMADFARLAVAAAPALGWTGKDFLAAYAQNRQEQDQAVLDDSVITPYVVGLVREQGKWSGTASELLAALRKRADEPALKDRRWPRDATRLSGLLRRITPSLATVNIVVEKCRGEGRDRQRTIELRHEPPQDPKPDETQESAGWRHTASSASEASEGADDQEDEDTGTLSARSDLQRPPTSPAASVGGSAQALPPTDTPTGVDVDAPRTLRDGASVRDVPGGADIADTADADSRTPSETASPTGVMHGLDEVRVAAVGSGPLPLGDLVVITDAEAARRVVGELVGLPVVGLDSETLGLDPRSHRVRLVQVAAADGRVYIFDRFRLDARLLAPLFAATTGPLLVGHNLKFDLQMLAEAGLPIPTSSRLFDTLLVAHLLEDSVERFPAGHFSLAGVAERYLGAALDKSLQTSDWSGPLTDQQIAYAASDAAILPKLHTEMTSRIEREGLGRAVRLEARALPAVVWLEQSGAPFDQASWATLAEDAVRRQLDVEAALATEAGLDRAVNWASPKQILQVLAERGHDVTSTSEAMLAGLADREPLVRLLMEYRDASKRVGTYGLDYLRHVHPSSGRIHPSWQQLGARSGRMSCSRPNLQNVPRDPAYRRCFRPSEGRVLVRCDYSQIELRIAAELANDQRMIEAFVAGVDVHTVTAAAVLGRQNGEITKQDRQAAKAIGFGLLYGAGSETLRDTARREYGIDLSASEAAQFRQKFFETYSGLDLWHCSQARGAIDTRSASGRRRLGVSRFTEKLNSPVQGTGADGVKAALALLWESRDRCPSAMPALAIHDEIVVECDAAEAEQAQSWLVGAMTRGMESFVKRVPIVVEATICRDWSGTPLTTEAGGDHV